MVGPSAMADASKKEKLAAARKKLKKFQQTKGSPQSTNRNSPLGHINARGDSPKITPSKSENSFNDSVNLNNGSVEHNSSTRSTESVPEPIAQASDALNKSQGNYASTESLQQLSRQLNGILSQSSALSNNVDGETNGVEALELRNQELAAHLQQVSQANEQLLKQISDLKQHNNKLTHALESDKKSSEDKHRRELASIKEQLQVHIQTIGILVAEKTELQSALTQTQKAGEQSIEEIEELSGRLKASRQRVADLEKSFSSASTSSQKHEQSKKEYSKEVDRLKMELYRATKSNEEYQQQNSELQEKLQKKVAESSQSEDTVIELRGKLEMTELYLQQLQNGDDKTNETQQIEQLLTDKSELQNKVDQYEAAFQQVVSERDQTMQQYQQYIENINSQAQILQQQIENMKGENEQLLAKQTELLQQLETAQASKGETEEESNKSAEENTALREMMEKVKADNEALTKQHQALLADNEQLSMMVTEKEARLEELDMQVQQMSDNTVDKDKLLDSMQSDKVALSRAVAQNKELKVQLSELQNGFVKMSNENMDMMSTLKSEQHVAKELAARLSQQEDELKDIREKLALKENELREVQKAHHMEEHKQVYTNEQIEDRLRHYEAQARLVETLQKELTSAQDAINALTNQNSHLKSQIFITNNNPAEGETSIDDSKVESLNASVRQLEMERNQVLEQLQEEKRDREEVQGKLQEMEHTLATQTPATLNGDIVNKAQFAALQHAMNQLEGKYTQAMNDKAELSDRNEQMEHIVLQLQGETDTIGEYIALYQQQRFLLKQTYSEKEEYISRLSRDRQELQEKFIQLEKLVMQLLYERDAGASFMAGQMASPPSALPNHLTTSPEQGKRSKRFGSTLNSSELEDWPDYTSSGSESEDSEVEEIIGQPSQIPSPDDSAMDNSLGAPVQVTQDISDHSVQDTTDTSAHQEVWDPNNTAQKIMHLLSELHHANHAEATGPVVERWRNVLQCSNCSGRVLHV